MNVAIAFIIFNRPEETKRVINALRTVAPSKMYVIADGPRNSKDEDLCRQARAVIDTIDWKCDIKKLYSEKNLGCGISEFKGITWVFNQEERAIILEDDCVPDPSFFPYCEELLERYKDDQSVIHISGNFFQQKNSKFRDTNSYYGSILPHVWGWATWRRGWAKYDNEMTQWPEAKRNKTLVPWFDNPAAYEYWEKIWDQYYNEKINNHDARWVFACMLNKTICINPTVNLITNIGFGENATHAKTFDDSANLPVKEMIFPLRHPQPLMINKQADRFTFRKNFGIDEKIRYRLVRPIKTHFPKFYIFIRNIAHKILRLN